MPIQTTIILQLLSCFLKTLAPNLTHPSVSRKEWALSAFLMLPRFQRGCWVTFLNPLLGSPANVYL